MPYREVPLHFFSSSILFPYCPILFFKCVLKIILSIISAAILLIQTRWVRVRAEYMAGKRQNKLSYCVLSTVQNEFLAGQDDVFPVLRGFLLSPSPSLLLLNLKSPFSLQRSFGGKSFRARIFSNLLAHSSTLIAQVETHVKTLVLIPCSSFSRG